jgi:hypothetical protein
VGTVKASGLGFFVVTETTDRSEFQGLKTRVRFKKDPCQGIAFRHAGKFGDSITRAAFDTSRRSAAKARPGWLLFRHG